MHRDVPETVLTGTGQTCMTSDFSAFVHISHTDDHKAV